MNTASIDVVHDAPGGGGTRYSALSIALHWTIALLIFVQIGLGWYMNEVLPDHSPAQDSIQDVHVSLGLTTLVLIVVRLVCRLVIPAPALPKGLPNWERQLARAMHILFYVLMIVLPLSGWLLLTVRHAPISLWGLNWPALPGLAGETGPAHRGFSRAVKHFHIFTLIWIAWGMVFLHVAGALVHQFDGYPVLWRMLPFLKAKT